MPPPYCYDYPRPAVTVDLAAFALVDSRLSVLLVRRGRDPFAGSWALPGGFLEIDEPPDAGARRELREETHLDPEGPIHPVGFYAGPDRDPRGRTISLAYATVIRGSKIAIAAGDDAADASWHPALISPPLAFDHALILRDALAWVAQGIRLGELGLSLLPEEFDAAEIATLYRAAFGSTRGAGHWLKRMEGSGLIEPRAGSARLYRAVSGDIKA